jgi:hypothetical protein
VVVGDFNGDGRQDLAVACSGSNTVSIRLGDGAGNFSGSTGLSGSENLFSVVVGDFNGDGRQDLAFPNSLNKTVSIRLGDGAGNFSGSTEVGVVSKPRSVVVGDFNGDGRQDLAIANTRLDADTVSIRLGRCNLPPTITAASGLSRQQGSAAANSQIATVTNGNNGNVNVTVTSANPSNGVTISNIINTNGNIAADIAASCSASNATFTLQASDGTSTATDTLSVTVTANTAPILTYASPQSVTFNGPLNVTPTTASDNGSIAGYAVQSVVPALTAAPTVNASGVVSIANAQPAGTHTITIRATDSCGAVTDASFALNVNKAATTTALSSSSNPSGQGQSVTFTAIVSSAAGTPTGTVQFKADGGNIGDPVSLNASGVATLTTTALAAGSHAVTADYGGDSNFSASTGSLASSQVVGGVFEFAQPLYTVAERAGIVSVNVRRTGDTSQAMAVDFATDDGSTPSVAVPCSSVTGIALERCDFTRAVGTLSFAPGETEKTFTVLVNDDSYTEGPETLALRLSNLGGSSTLGAQASAVLQIDDDVTESTGNPIDDAEHFVRMQYHDFLGREPDAGGLAFWKGGITSCGSDAQCREVKRIDTSAAFFLSIEFQNTGYLVERMYKAAFGDANGITRITGNPVQIPVPIIRRSEFLTDSAIIRDGVVVGVGNWEQQLDNNKNAFALAFVQRQRFTSAYPLAMTPTAFVDQLNANVGGALDAATRQNLIDELTANNTAAERASVFRKVAENTEVDRREKNRAFVLMQFFGYLQRDPDAAPDTDHTGWKFWLDKLDGFGGDFRKAEMVKAFISSSEYRLRFGQ